MLQQGGAKIGGGSPNQTTNIFVIDTNVLISGILYNGTAGAALEHIIIHQRVILSDYILEEFMRCLRIVRPKQPHKWTRELRKYLETYITDDGDEVIVEDVRDMKDEPLIRLAARHEAAIITGDKDLLEYRGAAKVVVLSVGEYLELFVGEGLY